MSPSRRNAVHALSGETTSPGPGGSSPSTRTQAPVRSDHSQRDPNAVNRTASSWSGTSRSGAVIGRSPASTAVPDASVSAAASRSWSNASRRVPSAGSTTRNRVPAWYQKRVPSDSHCGATVLPGTLRAR